MMKQTSPVVYTIGHSNRSIETFIAMLQSFSVQMVVDVRRFPGSAKWPQFNQAELEASLAAKGMSYVHIAALGGRRKPAKDSPNTAWRHPAFRAYADYMETQEFRDAVAKLEQLARETITVYMCSEAVWWSCHRSMISDYLKVKGWKVMHIMAEGKASEHPSRPPARVVNGELTYREG
ncbi:MAG TPA: DUF488 domain-containing protein [Chitinophagaceae bacterium]